MKLHNIEKNFLSTQEVAEVLTNLESDNNWVSNIYAPMRSTGDIRNFPILENIYKTQFSKFNLLDNRIYFTRYTKDTQCFEHKDPCRFTVLVILQKAELGGEIKVNETIFDPSVGDALMIRGSDIHEILTINQGQRLSLAFWLY
jgi:hypothetical protein